MIHRFFLIAEWLKNHKIHRWRRGAIGIAMHSKSTRLQKVSTPAVRVPLEEPVENSIKKISIKFTASDLRDFVAYESKNTPNLFETK